MMREAWEVTGFTYLLTIVVSLFVASIIHMMTLLIRRFGAKAAPLPVSAVQEPEVPAPDNPDELAAVAIAVALRRIRREDGR